MRSDARHRRTDPELDPSPVPVATGADDIARGRSRLIANPFLALLGGLLAGSALKAGLSLRDPVLSLAALFCFFASILLIQYHCLDCGGTGWAVRARRHLCPRGAARAAADDVGRTPGLTMIAQIKIWIAVAITVSCYYLLNAAARR